MLLHFYIKHIWSDRAYRTVPPRYSLKVNNTVVFNLLIRDIAESVTLGCVVSSLTNFPRAAAAAFRG